MQTHVKFKMMCAPHFLIHLWTVLLCRPVISHISEVIFPAKQRPTIWPRRAILSLSLLVLHTPAITADKNTRVKEAPHNWDNTLFICTIREFNNRQSFKLSCCVLLKVSDQENLCSLTLSLSKFWFIGVIQSFILYKTV